MAKKKVVYVRFESRPLDEIEVAFFCVLGAILLFGLGWMVLAKPLGLE